MANENDIGGKVSLDTTDFKANIAELNRQIKVIDSGFRAAAAGMDNWGKSEEGLQARIESLNDITDLQRQKIANLTAQYEKVASEKGETSKAAQDLQIRINKETEALNKNLSELRKVSDALENFETEAKSTGDQLGNLEKSAEDAGEGLREIGSNATSAAATGIAAVGAAALAAIGSLTGFANSTDKAMNKFQAQTGASVEEMEEFRDVAEELYKANLGDSIEDVANSMATARQVTGQVGEELENTTRNALLLRDTFDFDVNESVRAADSLMKQFGITSDEAYTLIAQGAQNGANRNGDMLDVLNEYAPQFQALGFSADEFTNILIDGAENGAFSIDKVGDAVKEFNIRAKDLSDTSLEAFEMLGLNGEEMSAQFAAGGEAAQLAFSTVIQKLGEIEDPLQRNAVGVGLFGTQFEDLEAGAIVALGNIGTTANSTADTLQQINDVRYDDAGTALEGLKRTLITEIAEPIGQQVLPVIHDLIEDVKNVDVTPIVDTFSWLIDNAGNIASGAAAIGAAMLTWNVVSMITGLVTAFNKWRVGLQGVTIAQAALNVVMAANPIGLIITAVAALVAGIITLWNTNDDFREFMIGTWEAIKNGIISAVNFIKEHWDTLLMMLTNPIAGQMKLLYELNPRFKDWVDSVVSTIVNTFKKLPETIGNFFRDIIDRFVQFHIDAYEWVTTEIPKIIDSIVQFFNELPGKIGYALGYALGSMIRWGLDAIEWIKTEVPKMIESIASFFAELPGRLWDALVLTHERIVQFGIDAFRWVTTEVPRITGKIISFFGQLPGELWNWLLSAHNNIVQWGLDLLSWAKESVPGVVDNIISFFADLPSRMVEIGKEMVMGLWDGIKNMTTWMKDKVSEFAGGVVSGIKDALDIRSPSRVMRDEVGKMIGLGIAEGINDSIQQVDIAMRNLTNETQLGSVPQAQSAPTQTINNISLEGLMSGANIFVQDKGDIRELAKEIGDYIFAKGVSPA